MVDYQKQLARGEEALARAKRILRSLGGENAGAAPGCDSSNRTSPLALETGPSASPRVAPTPTRLPPPAKLVGGGPGWSAPRIQTAPKRSYVTPMGRNLDRLRLECGWSFDEIARVTDFDKKLILGHVNHGKNPHPRTLAAYARIFTKKLGRPVNVAELIG